MRVKLTIEDSSERWITLDEAEAKELQSIFNSIFKTPTSIIVPEGTQVDMEALKGTLDKESPGTLRDICVKDDCYHNDPSGPEYRSHI